MPRSAQPQANSKQIGAPLALGQELQVSSSPLDSPTQEPASCDRVISRISKVLNEGRKIGSGGKALNPIIDSSNI